MVVRPYCTEDRQACLDILEENTPEFFVPEERGSFETFLAHRPGPYFVGEENGAVMACGGWATDSVDVVALTWGMVGRSLHRRGIGRALLRFRLDAVRNGSKAEVVRIHTVQLVQGFFAKQGFSVVDVVPDEFGPGLNRVTMELRLRAAVEQGVETDGRCSPTGSLQGVRRR